MDFTITSIYLQNVLGEASSNWIVSTYEFNLTHEIANTLKSL